MTKRTDERIPSVIQAMELDDEEYFFDQFEIYVGAAKEVEEKIKRNYKLSVSEVNRELDKVKKMTIKLQCLFENLDSEVASKLNSEHNMNGKPLSDGKESLKYAAMRILDTICFYCEQAEKNNDQPLKYTDIEILLANDFEKQGKEIKISDNGCFAILLREFRDTCDISGFRSEQINALYIKRLLERRKDNRTFPQNSQQDQ